MPDTRAERPDRPGSPERSRDAPSDDASPDASVLVRDATRRLMEAGITSARADAELLLAHAVASSRSEVQRAILLREPVDTSGAASFSALVARRVAREPLQHLTGSAPFRHLDLAVGPGVFVPRPETEVVAQVAIDATLAAVAAGRPGVVADLCTGSGAIALAVATEVRGATVHAVELDADAYAWARRNAAATSAGSHGVPGAQGSTDVVRLVRGDARTALRDLDGTVDVVVSNPPYVPSGATPRDPEVARHDPAVALYGLGPDGLEVPSGIVLAAARLLAPGGTFVMEHAETQAAAVRDLVSATGAFDGVRTGIDLTGRDRYVVARRLARDTPDDVGDCAP